MVEDGLQERVGQEQSKVTQGEVMRMPEDRSLGRGVGRSITAQSSNQSLACILRCAS